MADTFYVLDLGCCAPDEFAQHSAAQQARSPAGAAEAWASTWDEFHDGMAGECLVADNPAGDDAQRYTVRCRITTEFTAKAAGDQKRGRRA